MQYHATISGALPLLGLWLLKACHVSDSNLAAVMAGILGKKEQNMLHVGGGPLCLRNANIPGTRRVPPGTVQLPRRARLGYVAPLHWQSACKCTSTVGIRSSWPLASTELTPDSKLLACAVGRLLTPQLQRGNPHLVQVGVTVKRWSWFTDDSASTLQPSKSRKPYKPWHAREPSYRNIVDRSNLSFRSQSA